MSIRTIQEVIVLKEAIEGAGVKLHRGFGYFELPRFDPFLLFDDFSSANFLDYAAGFPLHPHRGIETVTYVLKGDVHHKDSMKNEGYIGAGDVQWMTAGSGIVHEEMPGGESGLTGFQLWVNLPHSHKMMSPRYQEIKADQIPKVSKDGVHVAVIAGRYEDILGPVKDIVVSPTYLDITLAPNTVLELPTKEGDTAFAYIVRGALTVSPESDRILPSGHIVLFTNKEDTIHLKSNDEETQILFVSGTPLSEPIAWHGPIVMNTDAEIRVALEDLRNGTFVK
jgi:quercetin 2,3-dioxygenase